MVTVVTEARCSRTEGTVRFLVPRDDPGVLNRTGRLRVLLAANKSSAQMDEVKFRETVPGVAAQGKESDRGAHWLPIVACALFFCALISYNFVDIDIWHQMALIRESLAAGHLLKVDVYAYTPTIRPWVDHEWGAGAIAYFLTTWIGSRSILLLKFAAALGTLWVCLSCARRRGVDLWLFAACAPLAIYLMYLGFFSTIRAQVYSFFLTALLLGLLELDRAGNRRWSIPWFFVFLIWINVHAGFVVGVGLVALHLAEQAYSRSPWRHLLWLLLAMSLVVLANPYGIVFFAYLRHALFMARPFSPEWNSVLTLGSYTTASFGVALLVALYAMTNGRFKRIDGILILLVAAVEGALHRKLLPLFAIAWLCYVPSYLQHTLVGGWWVRFCERRSRFCAVASAIFGCVCLLAALRQKPWELVIPQPIYPVGPVQFLKEQKFRGNVLVPFRLGAYVSWKLYPSVKVSLDSRYEVAYSDVVMRDVFDFYEARPGWQSTLPAYPTDLILIPNDTPISKQVQTVDWHPVYIDRQFALYARRGWSLSVEDWSKRSFAGTFP